MKSHKFLMFILIIVCSLLIVTEVEGAIVNPVDNTNLPANTITYVNNSILIYYINDSAVDGVFKVNGVNATLDCNGTTIIGNSSGYGVTSAFSGNHNATIRNCNFQNYLNALSIGSIDGNNFSNNNFINNTEAIRLNSNSDNNIISNNNITCIKNLATYGIRGASSKNTIYQSNNIYECNISIFASSGTDSNNTVRNNYILNTWNTTYGITFNGGNDSKAYNNIVINPDNYDASATNKVGIGTIGLSSNRINISNNIINGYGMGINFDVSNNSYAGYNNVSNVGGWGVATRSNYTILEFNNIYNTSWNGLHFDAYYHTIRNNYISNYIHHGIDAHWDYNATVSGNSNIYNNEITQSIQGNTYWYGQGSCALIQASSNNNIFNNSCHDIYTNISQPTGWAVEGENYTLSNNVYNNTFYNLVGQCIYDSAYNTTWTTNTLTNCTVNDIYTFGGYVHNVWTNNAKFIDNINTLSNLSFYLGVNNRSNITITQSNKEIVTITGNANNIINLKSYSSNYPYNDIKNISNGVILSSNVDNYSLTLTPNQQISIENYGSKVWTPNILSIFDINSNNYFDRLVKGTYGNIPRLPDNQNGFQTSFMITPQAVNQSINVTIPLCQQINAYSGDCNRTALSIANMRVCYSSIYGGPIACTTNYTYTLQ